MDPLTALILVLPFKYAVFVLASLGLASLTDAILPPVDPSSKWAIARAGVHYAGMNFASAFAALRKDR